MGVVEAAPLPCSSRREQPWPLLPVWGRNQPNTRTTWWSRGPLGTSHANMHVSNSVAKLRGPVAKRKPWRHDVLETQLKRGAPLVLLTNVRATLRTLQRVGEVRQDLVQQGGNDGLLHCELTRARLLGERHVAFMPLLKSAAPAVVILNVDHSHAARQLRATGEHVRQL